MVDANEESTRSKGLLMTNGPSSDFAASNAIESCNSVASIRILTSLNSRIFIYSTIFLMFQLIILLGFTANNYGLIGAKPPPTNADFISFYSAGILADTDEPELAYSKTRHGAAEQAIVPVLGYKFFYYPPVFMLLCSVLGQLSYNLSFTIFESVTLNRGRDAHYCAPPAQNRTCGIPAYGSHLGCLTVKRCEGQG
jgi:hypothetical protein